MIKSILS